MKNAKGTVFRVLIIALVVCGLGLIGYYLYREYSRPPEPQPILDPLPPPSEPEPEPGPEPEPVEPLYPEGKLITESPERTAYEDADLELYIPRIDFKGPVYNGVDDATLLGGVGLFDYATLPNPQPQYNSNTSIAGHRDLHGYEFYYIHWVIPGDKIYLKYGGYLYTYEVEDIFVTDPYNWYAIEVRDHPVVTLQSCTPIGVASHRIFVVGGLVNVQEGAEFPAPTAGETGEPDQQFAPETLERDESSRPEMVKVLDASEVPVEGEESSSSEEGSAASAEESAALPAA